MKEMYFKYKKEFSNKNKITLAILIVFIIGIIFGSFYLTILSNEEKTLVIKKVNNYFISTPKINFEQKLILFKNTMFSNILFFSLIWFLGISIIGIPITFIMTFFKGFLTGFSLASIFACFKFKGLLAIILYIFPNTLITCLYSLFLAVISLNLSYYILECAFKKKSLNFNLFMGKYFFIFVITILLCIIISVLEAFVSPNLINIYTKFIK